MAAIRCTVCLHQARAEIDAGLVAGESLRGSARKYGLSHPAVTRHRDKHLSPALSGMIVARKADEARSLLDRVTRLVDDAETVLAGAKQEGRADLALRAVAQVRETLKLLGQVTGELKPDGATVQVLNVQTSDEWVRLRGVILAALAPFPEARVAVAHALAGGSTETRKIPAVVHLTPYREDDALRGSEAAEDEPDE